MGLLILFFALSICFSFLCSIWEAVILSITPAYVNRKVQEEDAIGATLKRFKDDIDKPLSAILTLNTIAHTVGAIGVGAQAGAVYGSGKIDLGFYQLSYESIIATIMTLAILILSEIIPKTIGANKWQSLAPWTIKSLKIVMWILTPFVWMSQSITKRLKKDKARSIFSRADFAALTKVGQESGALADSESKIIDNLLRFEKLTVNDIMTPRAVMSLTTENQTVQEFYKANKPLQFSRIPVYSENQDNIQGIILKDDILLNLAEDQHDTTLKGIRREVISVNNQLPLQQLFDTLATKGQHIAIVNDDYGTLVGLVTMEDLFETLLGLEIVDESDKVDDLQRLARKQWQERAKKYGLLNEDTKAED